MGLFDNFNFDKLKQGLTKTRNKIVNTITETISGKAVIDDKTIDDIEEILVTSDIGYETAKRVIDISRQELKSRTDRSSSGIIGTIKEQLIKILENVPSKDLNEDIKNYKPYVILIIGINGSGKTTTVGKLAHNFKTAGLKVIIGAADTFRAAANEQLEIWAKRAGVEIIQNKKSTDPSSVAFDTVQFAVKNKFDIVIIDTAGRLHTKVNLMDELNKIKRVIAKIIPYAPNDILLVLDGNSGQNALIQADEFSKATNLNGLIITKLDGTAKGGVIFQICDKKKIPVRYIGVGEGLEDLQTFDAKLFVSAIFNEN